MRTTAPGCCIPSRSTLYELRLSLELAKIGTHFDQVIDVFYVTDQAGRKVTNTQQIREIRGTLWDRLAHFEREGYQAFVSSRV